MGCRNLVAVGHPIPQERRIVAVTQTLSQNAKPIAVGIIAGLLSGLLGVGGGFVMVPLFVLWMHIDQKKAHATSLAAIMPIATFSAIGYAIQDKVDWSAWILVLAGSVFGANYGVRLLHRIPVRELKFIFSGLLLLSALRLLWSTQPHQLMSGTASHILLVVIGFIAGVAAGLLGVGGGIIIVPSLIIAAGLDATVARGTSLAVIVGTAISGTIAHHRRGNIVWSIVIPTGLAGIPASIVGTYLGTSLPERITMALFSIVLVFTAYRMARSASE